MHGACCAASVFVHAVHGWGGARVAVNGGGEKRGAAFRPPFLRGRPRLRAQARPAAATPSKGEYIYIYIYIYIYNTDVRAVGSVLFPHPLSHV